MGENSKYVQALPDLLTRSLFFEADFWKNQRIPDWKKIEYVVKILIG
jgi:hypothetical protein